MVGPGLELSTCAWPSQTLDPDLGVMVKYSFLLFLKDIFNISFNTFRTPWTTWRPRPPYRVSCFRLTATFLILSFFLFLCLFFY